MILLRFILICIIIYLLIRSFVSYFTEEKNRKFREHDSGRSTDKKSGVSKEIGEYVDYEEVD